MPDAFRRVDQAWNLNARAVQERLTSHEPTESEKWTYTLTYKYFVNIGDPDGPRVLRGHVHYTPEGSSGKHKAAPGHFWVQGIQECEGVTPMHVVNKVFPDLESLKDWQTLKEWQDTGLEAIGANAAKIFE